MKTKKTISRDKIRKPKSKLISIEEVLKMIDDIDLQIIKLEEFKEELKSKIKEKQ